MRELVIPPAILDWLGEAVLNSDRTEQAARAEANKKLQARHDQIEARIGTMYLDKLDGRITQEFFDKQAGSLRREQDSLLCKIQDIRKATPVPSDHAIDTLRLTSRASELFLQQPAVEQRRLLQMVVQKPAWKDRTLQTACSNRLKFCATRTGKVIETKRRKLGLDANLCGSTHR